MQYREVVAKKRTQGYCDIEREHMIVMSYAYMLLFVNKAMGNEWVCHLYVIVCKQSHG